MPGCHERPWDWQARGWKRVGGAPEGIPLPPTLCSESPSLPSIALEVGLGASPPPDLLFSCSEYTMPAARSAQRTAPLLLCAQTPGPERTFCANPSLPHPRRSHTSWGPPSEDHLPKPCPLALMGMWNSRSQEPRPLLAHPGLWTSGASPVEPGALALTVDRQHLPGG